MVGRPGLRGAVFFAAVRLPAGAPGRHRNPGDITDAEKLKFVQEKLEAGHAGAQKIWQSMGIYLGYGLAHYADFYDIKHVLILGRCTSGSGGNLILEGAHKVLQANSPSWRRRSMSSCPMKKAAGWGNPSPQPACQKSKILGGKWMNFHLNTAEIFVPDGLPVEQALARTTHMAIAAHQDDIEIMAAGPILECFQQADKWFTGVVVTDGRGSPRDDLYKNYTDEEMRAVRFKEQRKAAVVGEYAAQVMLDYPSKMVKDGSNNAAGGRSRRSVEARPAAGGVYTHNLADKHDTHVSVALRTIAAIRSLPESERPQKLYGCEVWRDLDWMVDSDKVSFDLTKHENLQAALLGVFELADLRRQALRPGIDGAAARQRHLLRVARR